MKNFAILFFVTAFAISQITVAQNLPKEPPKLKLSEPLPGNLFVELARVINPAVVNISTTALPKSRPRLRDPMLDMLEQLYGFHMQQPMQTRPQQIGLGTGFIIREDGNNHEQSRHSKCRYY
jgi:serine protease Do